jgi:hypothetical protein
MLTGSASHAQKKYRNKIDRLPRFLLDAGQSGGTKIAPLEDVP